MDVRAHLHLVVVVGQHMADVLGVAEPNDRIRRDLRLAGYLAVRLDNRIVVAVVWKPFLVCTCMPAAGSSPEHEVVVKVLFMPEQAAQAGLSVAGSPIVIAFDASSKVEKVLGDSIVTGRVVVVNTKPINTTPNKHRWCSY